MWIKTEDCRIYNLHNAQAVEAIETERGWVVTARFTGTQVRATEENPSIQDADVALLTNPKSEDAALRVVDEIAHAMRGTDDNDEPGDLLDLNDIHTGQRRRTF